MHIYAKFRSQFVNIFVIMPILFQILGRLLPAPTTYHQDSCVPGDSVHLGGVYRFGLNTACCRTIFYTVLCGGILQNLLRTMAQPIRLLHFHTGAFLSRLPHPISHSKFYLFQNCRGFMAAARTRMWGGGSLSKQCHGETKGKTWLFWSYDRGIRYYITLSIDYVIFTFKIDGS